jgi:hypothetical protein
LDKIAPGQLTDSKRMPALTSITALAQCAITSSVDHRAFDAMIGAYQPSGGAVRADDFAMLLEERQKGNFVSLVKQIVSRDIFSFEWQNDFWIPMFQFHRGDMSVKQEARRVVHELTSVLDNWTLALWFTEPNGWLKGRRPVDMIDRQFSEVLGAARADRFVATG